MKIAFAIAPTASTSPTAVMIASIVIGVIAVGSSVAKLRRPAGLSAVAASALNAFTSIAVASSW
jgi:hypothetical protein